MKTEILELLETKNFDELTDEERTGVHNYMSEIEYREQRKLILSATVLATEEKAELVPNPQLLIIGQEKLPKRKSGALIVFGHKTPTWVTVAACLLLFFGIRGFYNSKNSGVETIVVTETINDTIYSEKIVTEQLPGETVVKYIYVNEPKIINETVDNSNSYKPEEPSFEHLHFREDQYCTIMSCYESKKGKTVANDTLLWLSQVSL